ESRDIGAIGKENIGAAVTVVVKNGDTSSHSLRDILRGTEAAVELKRQTLKFESDGTGGLWCGILLTLQKTAGGQGSKRQRREMDRNECRPAHVKGRDAAPLGFYYLRG